MLADLFRCIVVELACRATLKNPGEGVAGLLRFLGPINL